MELPTILCIHGQGTNGTIFRLQARHIVRALQHHFRFVFVDAPFVSLPGPGVVPIFSEFEPFLRWHCDENTLENFDITPEELDAERLLSREMLIGHISRESEKGGIVGIMAFSQGTRVATGLMLDALALGLDLKFAVLICATFPALLVSPRTSSLTSTISSVAPSSTPPDSERLSIRSIHVQGSYDPWAAEGVRLMETYFDPNLARTVKFEGGHQVPIDSKAVTQLTEMMLEI